MSGWRHRFAMACGYLSAIAVAAMMLVTVADVVLRAAINLPIRGALEIVELLLAVTFFLALPATFLRDEHINVDIIDRFVGARGVDWLKRLAALLSVLLLAVLFWQGWIAAQDTLVFNDVTSDLAIPKIVYWIPILIGFAGAIFAALAMAFYSTPTPPPGQSAGRHDHAGDHRSDGVRPGGTAP